MLDDNKKANIKDFLKKHNLTVIATIDVDGNKPECAVIAFTENENLELMFGTSCKTRKYANLQKNKNVSFVIGWSGAVGTMQYEGAARELLKEEYPEYAKAMEEKNPGSAKYVNDENQRYFLVTPKWLRLQDMSATPAEDFEVNF